jgi:flagellar protein FlaG
VGNTPVVTGIVQALAARPERVVAADVRIQPEPQGSDNSASNPTTAYELSFAISRIQQFVEPLSSDLEFSLDEASGMRVVRVIDRSTKELIRQIPSQEALTIAAALDKLQGLLIRQKA